MLISAHRTLENVGEVMPHNVIDALRRFLNIEAQVDNEEDDGEGEVPGPGELTPVFCTSAHSNPLF